MSVFDILKLLLSKDTRETAGQVLGSLKRSPEWKKDLITLEGHFAGEQKEQTRLLVGSVMKSLASKAWDEEDIQTVRFVCMELIANAFEHGLRDKPKGSIYIRAQVSSDFFDVVVESPGAGFNLQEELERQRATERVTWLLRSAG